MISIDGTKIVIEGKRLEGQKLNLEMFNKVEIIRSDISNVKEIIFSEDTVVYFEDTLMNKNIDLRKCLVAELYDCDFYHTEALISPKGSNSEFVLGKANNAKFAMNINSQHSEIVNSNLAHHEIRMKGPGFKFTNYANQETEIVFCNCVMPYHVDLSEWAFAKIDKCDMSLAYEIKGPKWASKLLVITECFNFNHSLDLQECENVYIDKTFDFDIAGNPKQNLYTHTEGKGVEHVIKKMPIFEKIMIKAGELFQHLK